MRHDLLLPLALVACLSAKVAQADPPRPPSINCTPGGLAERPSFTQASPGRAEYHFAGGCIRRDGRSFGYRADGTWTPSEGAPNANASEIYHVDATSGPSRSYVVILGARCESDPWLHHAKCLRVGDNLSGELRVLWPELIDSSFPHSQYGVPEVQRAALRGEYARANGGARTLAFTEPAHRQDGIGVPDKKAARQTRAGPAHRTTEATALNPQPLPPGPVDIQTRSSQRPALGNAGNGSATALNPQPLPPGPPDAHLDPSARGAAATGAETSIIIVSGKNANPADPSVKKKPHAAAGANTPERINVGSPQH